MSDKEKLAILEEMFEMDEGDISVEMLLEDIEEWDSMARVALVVVMSDEFDKTITNEDMDKFQTIQDIMNFMSE